MSAPTVTSLLSTAVAVLERAEVPDEAVNVDCGRVGRRLHLDLRVRDEWVRDAGEEAAVELVQRMATRLAQSLNVDLFPNASSYADGRRIVTHFYVDDEFAFQVSGWTRPDAHSRAGAR